MILQYKILFVESHNLPTHLLYSGMSIGIEVKKKKKRYMLSTGLAIFQSYVTLVA